MVHTLKTAFSIIIVNNDLNTICLYKKDFKYLRFPRRRESNKFDISIDMNKIDTWQLIATKNKSYIYFWSYYYFFDIISGLTDKCS